MDLIKIAEEAFATGKQHPSFKAGDTVTVAYRIIEGNKERVNVVFLLIANTYRLCSTRPNVRKNSFRNYPTIYPVR